MAAVRAVALLVLVLMAALPTGAAGLRLLGLQRTAFRSRADVWLLAPALGLGMLAEALTLAGLAHALYPAVALALPVALGLAAAPSALGLLRSATAAGPGGSRPQAEEGPATPSVSARSFAWRERAAAGAGCTLRASDSGRRASRLGLRVERVARWVALAGLAVVAAAMVVEDLAPPTDYDGLLYHLVAPQRFLAAHAIIYLPENFSADLPALGEMLYAMGLAGGSDRMPQLLHGAAGALSLALCALFGRRFLGRWAAFWGTAALAATPLMVFLGTRAYIDLFTLLFSLVALYAFFCWQADGRQAWLRLAGAGAGLALGTKYAALSLAATLGAAVLVAAYARWRRERVATPGVDLLAATLPAAIAFGGTAALLGLPWYLRQWIALGSPVWPMYVGGRDWDGARVEQLTYFVSHYGAGHDLRAWLLLPWNVFTQSWRFGHVPDAYPPLLAVAAPLALAAWRRSAVAWLLGVSGATALLWAAGWQDLRFLLAAYPMLALLGVAGFEALLGRRAWGRPAVGIAVAGLCLSAAVREAPRAAGALSVVAGRETVPAYLDRRLPDYQAIQFLSDDVEPGGAALFLGDGQIWYCRVRCIPDAAHDNLLEWFERPGSPDRSLARLQQEGVSHILLSKRDYWYLEHQDPQDRLKRQLAGFYVFKARYLDLVYEDALTEVYRGRW